MAAQTVRFQKPADFGDGVAECVQLERESPFSRVQWHHRVDLGTGVAGFAEDGADTSVGVLQVHARVAGEGHHAVDVEDVVPGAGGRQVGVLDRADAGLLGDLVQLVFREVMTPFRYDGPRLVDGRVEQVHELDGVAGAGLERPTVRAQHGAERNVGDVDVVGEPAGAAGGLENQPEVQGLAGVEQPVGFEVTDAVADGGQIGGVVAVAPILLADHKRDGVTVRGRDLLGVHDEGTVAFHSDTSSGQLGDDVGQPGVVERLAGRVVWFQQHTEPVVDLLEGELGLSDDGAPAGDRGVVIGLQRHNPSPCAVGEGGVGVESSTRGPIQAIQR